MNAKTTFSRPFPPRRLLILCGPDGWITQQLAQRPSLPTSQEARLAVGVNLPDHQPIPAKQVQRVLGHSADSIVLDWRTGLNTNHLSALSGCLCAGGVLVLLLAEEAAWAQRYAWDATSAHTELPPFFAHFIACLQQQTVQWRTPLSPPQSADWLPLPWAGLNPDLTPNTASLREQADAVRAIVALPEQQQHHLLFTAPRGRGKSTALVLAAVQLAQHHTVILTAPFPEQRVLLQNLLAQFIPAAAAQPLVLSWDALPEALTPDTILLADEAAAFGLPRLRWLAKQGRWRVFASTTDGYEGSGQGLRLRFLPWLRQQRGGTKELTLSRPMRWAADDPLEQLLNVALLQNSRIAEAFTQQAPHEVKTLSELTAQQLLTPPWQTQWCNLLQAAHYQTRPEDVRQALDDAAVTRLAWTAGNCLYGMLLSLAEPPIDAPLADAVWQGKRRPPQQQAKQSIIGQLGHRPAQHWHGQRIWRLVVNPQYQGHGGGRALVAASLEQAKNAGCHYVATSFGLTPELVRFWVSAGPWRLVRVGQTTDPASGTRSGLWIAPISPDVEAWSRTAQAALSEQWLQQPETWQRLDDALLLALLDHLPPPALTDNARQRLQHWSASQQPLSAVRTWVCVAWWTARHQGIRHADDNLLLRLLWRGESWQDAQAKVPSSDQKALWRGLKMRLSAIFNP